MRELSIITHTRKNGELYLSALGKKKKEKIIQLFVNKILS